MILQIIRIIDHTLYPRRALAEARQAYQDYCTLEIVPEGNTKAKVTIAVKEAYEKESKQVVLDFLNYTLDRSVQIVLEDDAE